MLDSWKLIFAKNISQIKLIATWKLEQNIAKYKMSLETSYLSSKTLSYVRYTT